MLNALLWVMSWPLRFLFGRDVFISYARANGDTYVRRLADELRRCKPRISYFLDLYAAPADPVIPASALRHARWCRVFVLLASKEAMQMECGTTAELVEFVKRPKRLFVPIDVDGAYVGRDPALPPWNLVSGATPERETSAAVEGGVVSPAVIDRIESLTGSSRFESRLTRAALFAALLVAAGAIFFYRSLIAAGDARANRLAAAATSAMTTDYALSLLLAAEGVAIRPNLPFPRSALFDVITRHGGLITLLHMPQQGEVRALAVSPDGSMIATGDWSGVVRLWDAKTKKESHPSIKFNRWVLVVAFDRNATQLFIGTWNGFAFLYDLRTRQLQEAPRRVVVRAAAFRPEGGVAMLTEGGRILDPFTGETLLQTETETRSFAFSCDGAVVVSGGPGGRLQAFDWKTRRPLTAAMPKVLETQILSVVASPVDRTLFAAADEAGDVITFRPGETTAKRLQFDGTEPRLAFAPDGEMLAASDGDEIEIYGISDFHHAGRFSYAHPARSMAFADRNTLLTGNSDSTVALLSLDALDQYGPARALESRTPGDVESMKRDSTTATSGDGRRIAKLIPRNDDRVLVVRDRKTGEVLKEIALDDPKASLVALDKGGDRVAIGSTDGYVVAKSLCDGKNLVEFTMGDEGIQAIALSPDGDTLVASDVAETMIYSLDPPLLLGRRRGVKADCLVFAPDGKTLTVCESDGLHRWLMSSEDWIAAARRIAGRELTAEERTAYLGGR